MHVGMQASQVLPKAEMMHCDKSALSFSVPVKKLGLGHIIGPSFKSESHPMARVTIEENLDSTHFIIFSKDDLQPFPFNKEESGNVAELDFCNAHVQKEAGYH